MEQYTVTGMSCAACAARVEKAVSKVEGVTSCSVSLLTNTMGIEGTASPEDICLAVQNAGYGASLRGSGSADSAGSSGRADSARALRMQQEEALEDHETPVLKKRLIASVCFLAVLMYLSMGHHMWGWPVPKALHENMAAMGILQMLLAGIVMVINQKFFISGFRSMLHRAPNMDTLVALGSGVSFGYSVWALIGLTGAQQAQNMEMAAYYADNFYFESGALSVTLITK